MTRLARRFLAVVICCAQQAIAGDILWTASTASYNTPSNWLGFNLPSVAFNELASINNGGTAQLAGVAGDRPGGVKIARGTGSSGTLDILAGGSLVVAAGAGASQGQVEVGSSSGGGKLRVAPGGSLTAAGVLSSAAHAGNRIELGGDSGGAAALHVGAASLAGTTVLYPGASLVATPSAVSGATGGVALAPTSVFESRLAAGAGKIVAGGALTLGGTLAVSPLGTFAPAAGQTFDLFDAATVSGAFSSVTLPPLDAALAWNVSLLASTGVISIAYAGDFDFGGDVDGADLLVWQRGGSPMPNSPADLAAWRATFGLAASSPTAAAVSEPASLPLAVFFGLVALRRRRRIQPPGR